MLCQIFRVRGNLLALMLNRLMPYSAYNFSLPIRLCFFTCFPNSLHIWGLVFIRITVKYQIEVIHQDLFWLLTTLSIYVSINVCTHVSVCLRVWVKQQTSGFNHMQDVITLFFFLATFVNERDLAKKWTFYSLFKSTNGLRRKINRWKQERHLGL